MNYNENEIDIEQFDDKAVLKELREKVTVINDKRHESYVIHKLADIVMITLFAILANANEWEEIAEFGKKKEKWLRTFLELPEATPSADTIRIVISSILIGVWILYGSNICE